GVSRAVPHADALRARSARSTSRIERVLRNDSPRTVREEAGAHAEQHHGPVRRLTLSSGTMAGLAEFAEIALPVAVHGTFTYAIPPELRDGVRLGSRVEVPFGAKRSTGFVVALADAAPAKAAKIKAIRAVLDDEEPALVPEIIELCRWAADYYIAPLGEMLRMALPANMAARGR